MQSRYICFSPQIHRRMLPRGSFCFCSCVSAHSVELLSDSCFLIIFLPFCKMILSVPVIYRFCLTVVFFVAYRLVYGCILTYFVLNVNNSNYYCFIEFIYLYSRYFSRSSVKNAKNTPCTFGTFHCIKRMCLAHSRASRGRVRQSTSSRE